jgi:ubiquinone/menaquinone biosynthesis C-methylase UbiE
MSDYDRYADVYDAFYADYDQDIPFYVTEAQRAGSPVLELACGTGRVTVPVALAGIEVVGLDSSPAMLERCRKRLAPLSRVERSRVALVQADMRQFDLGGERFTLVYCPFRAFLHLLTVEDQLACLSAIHRHLRPGGRFALNFFDPSLTTIARSVTHGSVSRRIREYAHPQSGNRVIVHLSTRHDPATQTIHEYRIEDEIDGDGQVLKRTYRPLTLRWIYRYEFEHLLARSGFDLESLYGTFDRRPLGDEPAELIWIARRR